MLVLVFIFAITSMIDSVSCFKLESNGIIEKLRREFIISFDTKQFPLREALVAIIEEDFKHPLPTRDLSKLHNYKDHKCSHFDIDKSNNAIAYLQSQWNLNRDHQGDRFKRDTTAKDSDNYLQFEVLYQSLIKEVIGPSIGGGEVLYQRAPTFRTYLPTKDTNTPMGQLHKDEDYHHQPSEINFWVPISDNVGGTNTLWVETEPNKGDFHPLNLQYGEIYRGYLNQCRHFTHVNDSDYTRVSIDFRVVNDKTGGHDPNFHLGVRRGAKAFWQKKFDIGGFYNVIECHDGAVVV
jgi:hypothetical protein